MEGEIMEEKWEIRYEPLDRLKYSAYHLHDNGIWYWAGINYLPECMNCSIPTPDIIKFQVRLLRGVLIS